MIDETKPLSNKFIRIESRFPVINVVIIGHHCRPLTTTHLLLYRSTKHNHRFVAIQLRVKCYYGNVVTRLRNHPMLHFLENNDESVVEEDKVNQFQRCAIVNLFNQSEVSHRAKSNVAPFCHPVMILEYNQIET